MTHLDRDTLALVALAELELSAAEREHLAACPGCTGELDALRRTVLIGRSAGSVDLVTPADAVWGRIHSALGLSDAVATPPRLAADVTGSALTDAEPAIADQSLFAPPPAEPTAADLADPADPTGAGTGPEAGVPGAAAEGPERGRAPVTDLRIRRRRRSWVPVAAAACAVGLVGGVAGGAWWQSTRAPAPETVIAQAQLDALPGWTASGSALVEEAADGRREVVVDLDDADADGLREVWLLTADATGLVSVGLLDGSSGRFSIPAGVDLAEFPVVDVSAEPADGNPAHSGDSIVRGTLNTL
ncbi:anti-sigma factor [Cryobacterium lactosi]|uniref:Anti-sigma factor n=1 Tax=Cryobacterium lactosi TaxID=1259202 RepID=A0A4R9BU26_9MICO|nr:anti-sigma factor [Cryobacterium lactosi]TFD91125.1 anti-sigma factor [Cryobacterium lactosi]